MLNLYYVCLLWWHIFLWVLWLYDGRVCRLSCVHCVEWSASNAKRKLSASVVEISVPRKMSFGCRWVNDNLNDHTMSIVKWMWSTHSFLRFWLCKVLTFTILPNVMWMFVRFACVKKMKSSPMLFHNVYFPILIPDKNVPLCNMLACHKAVVSVKMWSFAKKLVHLASWNKKRSTVLNV